MPIGDDLAELWKAGAAETRVFRYGYFCLRVEVAPALLCAFAAWG